MFEKASRLNLRIKTNKGSLSVEDLWVMPLAGAFSLDTVARSLYNEIKEAGDVSFVTKKTSGNEILELKFEIVKHIIKVRLAEAEAKENELIAKEKRNKILSIIADKEDDSLKGKSVEELKAMLEEV